MVIQIVFPVQVERVPILAGHEGLKIVENRINGAVSAATTARGLRHGVGSFPRARGGVVRVGGYSVAEASTPRIKSAARWAWLAA